MDKKILHIVHCIDTEGPLNEGKSATFERLYEHFGINLEPTDYNFKLLIENRLDNKYGKKISSIFNSQTLNYNRNQDQLISSINKLTKKEFRTAVSDDFNIPWIYSWFCVSHRDCDDNPREKILGTHSIFDLYNELRGDNDDIQFHYHPLANSKNSSHSATGWLFGRSNLTSILAERLLDRNWFPSVNRPGFHVTRPDSHWFLEQFIPFDFANQRLNRIEDVDFRDKQIADWSRAPNTWVPYHPKHDDWQSVGSSKRLIGRCLNVGTRHHLLTDSEVQQAFEEVNVGKPAILAFTNHDFRDMTNDILETYKLIRHVQTTQYPNIKIKYIKACDAIRVFKNKKSEPINIQASLCKENGILEISADVEAFSIQPFFCYKSKTGKYYHDNLQIVIPYKKWTYIFDSSNLEFKYLEKIAFAINSKSGTTSICNANFNESFNWNKIVINS